MEKRSTFWAGRHAMVSWVHDEDISLIADVCQSFVIDNGAFTIWKTDQKNVTRKQLDGYYAFCELWGSHPACDWCCIPDVITGSEDDNDKLLDEWPFRWGVPVWHLHESLERLLRLASTYQIVALGSSGDYSTPGKENWWHRMREALRHISDGESKRPICKLHGMRMLDPAIFTRLPLHSADSTNAVLNSRSESRFGMYVPPSRAQRANVIADRIESYQSQPTCRFDSVQMTLYDRLDDKVIA